MPVDAAKPRRARAATPPEGHRPSPTGRIKKKRRHRTRPPAGGLAAALRATADDPATDARVAAWLKMVLAGSGAAGVIEDRGKK